MTRYGVRTAEAYLGAELSDERGSIDIGDDETILDTDFRGANRVVFVIGTPLGDGEPVCGVNGCSRTVDSADDVCWQHGN